MNGVDRKRCTVCGNLEGEYVTEAWEQKAGVTLRISKSTDPNVEDPRCPDEKVICEKCYRENRLKNYNVDEQFAIYTQFGIEYIRVNRHPDAEIAFRKAIGIKVTADGLAHLAYCLNALGNKEDAKRLYLMALDIDEHHFMARSNLSNLNV